MLRYVRFLLEVVASVVGIALLAAAFLIWRLHDQPLSTPALTSYLEAVAERFLEGADVRITSSLVAWDNVDHTMTLHVDGVKIADSRGVAIAALPSAGVKLNVFGLFVGQVIPTELMVDHLQINLTHEHDGQFYFGDMATQGAGGGQAMQARQILQRITSNLANAMITRKLRVSRTVINVYDSVSKNDWAVSIPEILLQRAQPGLVGEATIEVTQKEAVSTLAVYYEYDRLQKLHTVSTRFEGLNPSFFAGGRAETLGISAASSVNAPLTGEVKVSLGENERLDSAYVSLNAGAGYLRLRDVWDGDRPVKHAQLEADYHVSEGLTIKANVNFNGVQIKADVIGTHNAEGDALNMRTKMVVTNFPMDAFADLWPKMAIPNARDWIVANMHKGVFDRCEVEVTGRLPLWDVDQATLVSAQGTIEASRAHVIAIQGMDPVTNVSAVATFDLSKMLIKIMGGGSGNVKLQPFTMVMTGLDQVDQFIDIPLAITGAVADVIRLIDKPPLGYASSVGLSPDMLTGQVTGVVSLKLPLLKDLAMKDVDVSAQAELTNIAAPHIMEGITLSGGVLGLRVDKDGFVVKGKSLVNAVPVNVVWEDKFQPPVGALARSVDVDAVIAGEQWGAAGLSVLKGSTGNSFLTAKLRQLPHAAAKIDLTLDMTKAAITSDLLSWRKGAGVAAVLTTQVEVPPHNGPITITNIALSGVDVMVRGKAVVSQQEKALVSLQIKPFKIGRSDAEIYITPIKGEDQALHYDIEGKAFDVSGINTSSSGAKNDHSDHKLHEFRFEVERIYTSDTGVLQNFTGYAVKKGGVWQDVDLQASVDGGAKLSVLIKKNPAGRRTLAINADNFGKSLEGLGVTNTVRNGSLTITGISRVEEPQAIEGSIKINEFQVHGLPLLVNLFNATSPFGIGNLLTGTADFDKVRGKFVWRSDSVELRDVRASGSSIGLNVEGKVMTEGTEADLHGTVVPFTLVNKIVGFIPVIGDILTGGGEGILGVAYSIKGSLVNPKISVNPASLLTPGFLRNIFFGGDDEGYDGGSDTSSSAEPTRKKPEKPPVITNFNKGRG